MYDVAHINSLLPVVDGAERILEFRQELSKLDTQTFGEVRKFSEKKHFSEIS